jgi:putative transposase
MTKYKEKFRVESVRLQEWDYSNPWWYYVTICTKNHEEFFGKVVNEKMILNELGKIAEEEWIKTKEIRKNVDLDYYVIMPNHFHGIIIINGEEVETHRVRLKKGNIDNGDACDASLRTVKNCLSDIIRGFKSAVTKKARENGFNDFTWQARFYDRIIRKERELYNIRKYIQQNPLEWDLEKNIPENLDII